MHNECEKILNWIKMMRNTAKWNAIQRSIWIIIIIILLSKEEIWKNKKKIPFIRKPASSIHRQLCTHCWLCYAVHCGLERRLTLQNKCWTNTKHTHIIMIALSTNSKGPENLKASKHWKCEDGKFVANIFYPFEFIIFK